MALLRPVDALISAVSRETETFELTESTELPPHLDNMVQTASPYLTPEQYNQLSALITRMAGAFVGPDGKFGQTSRIKHTIDTGDAGPIKLPPRRMGDAQRKIVDEEIDKMLEEGVIDLVKAPGPAQWC